MAKKKTSPPAALAIAAVSAEAAVASLGSTLTFDEALAYVDAVMKEDPAHAERVAEGTPTHGLLFRAVQRRVGKSWVDASVHSVNAAILQRTRAIPVDQAKYQAKYRERLAKLSQR